MKLLYHTWFRTGSAYTANGIVDFLKEVEASLPENIAKVFFRADSGFFSGKLFDLLESFDWKEPAYRQEGLTGSSKRHKKQRKEENMENTPRVYGRGTFF